MKKQKYYLITNCLYHHIKPDNNFRDKLDHQLRQQFNHKPNQLDNSLCFQFWEQLYDTLNI